MAKTLNAKAAMIIGTLRPYSSDMGAQMMGPNAYPRTKREVPRVATSPPIAKSACNCCEAAENTLLLKVALRESRIRIADMPILDSDTLGLSRLYR